MLTAATFIHETYNGYFFGKAINLADRLCEEYDIVFKSYDVLVLPTITTKPPKVPMENENIFGKLKDVNVHKFVTRNCWKDG